MGDLCTDMMLAKQDTHCSALSTEQQLSTTMEKLCSLRSVWKHLIALPCKSLVIEPEKQYNAYIPLSGRLQANTLMEVGSHLEEAQIRTQGVRQTCQG